MLRVSSRWWREKTNKISGTMQTHLLLKGRTLTATFTEAMVDFAHAQPEQDRPDAIFCYAISDEELHISLTLFEHVVGH